MAEIRGTGDSPTTEELCEVIVSCLENEKTEKGGGGDIPLRGVCFRGVGITLPPSRRRELLNRCLARAQRRWRRRRTTVAAAAKQKKEKEEEGEDEEERGKATAYHPAQQQQHHQQQEQRSVKNPFLCIVTPSSRAAPMWIDEMMDAVAGGADVVSGACIEWLTLRGIAVVLGGGHVRGGGEVKDGGGAGGGGERELEDTSTSRSYHTELNLFDPMYKEDFSALAVGCECLCCRSSEEDCSANLSVLSGVSGGKGMQQQQRKQQQQHQPRFSRAYIHHLLQTHEMLAQTVLYAHNAQQVAKLIQDARRAIVEDRFGMFRDRYCSC